MKKIGPIQINCWFLIKLSPDWMAIPWQSIFAPLCVRFLLLVVVDAYKKETLWEAV